MTASHSASVMFTSMRSRRMPALLISTSTLPKASMPVATSFSAPAKSLMSSVLATAWPPAATISSTTCWAGPTSSPVPSMEPPRSFTTMLAPWADSSSACSRPMPRPAPVTMATRPSQMPIACSTSRSWTDVRRDPSGAVGHVQIRGSVRRRAPSAGCPSDSRRAARHWTRERPPVPLLRASFHLTQRGPGPRGGRPSRRDRRRQLPRAVRRRWLTPRAAPPPAPCRQRPRRRG